MAGATVESQNRRLSVLHPNLHISQGLKYKFTSMRPTFWHTRFLGNLLNQTARNNQSRALGLRVLGPQTVYIHSVCTLYRNMEATSFVL